MHPNATLSLEQRFARLPAAHPAEALKLSAGSARDYAALAEHHYLADRPATFLRVLVLRHEQPSLAARLGMHSPTADAAAPVAVLVESLPPLSCRMRDWALRDRFGRWLPPRQRARMINSEIRCISRVIVHPQWRGLGLAVRLVQAALSQPQTPYTEALAAMGRVNPFFERAGMTAYHRPRHAYDARMLDALHRVNIPPLELAHLPRAWQRIEALPEADGRWLLRELSRWFNHNAGRSARRDATPRDQLRAARQRLLLQPVYYLHDNRARQTEIHEWK